MANEPIHITDDVFETAVLKSTTPVIVDFWAPWCGPCRMVAPILDKIAKEYDGKVVVAKVNTDENPEWAQRYGVQGIPTMLFVANGKILHTQVGALPEGTLRDILTQFMEVSESIGLSKQSIYKKLKAKELQDNITKKQGVTYINEVGFNLIRDGLKANIDGLGCDKALQGLSNDWIRETSRYNYTYSWKRCNNCC